MRLFFPLFPFFPPLIEAARKRKEGEKTHFSPSLVVEEEKEIFLLLSWLPPLPIFLFFLFSGGNFIILALRRGFFLLSLSLSLSRLYWPEDKSLTCHFGEEKKKVEEEELIHSCCW